MSSMTVYGGSSNKVEERYLKVGLEVGRLLAKNKISLVFGGGSTGVIGELAKEFLKNSGSAVGVMTKDLVGVEGVLPGLEKVIVSQALPERKTELFKNADQALLMPGGYGSLDEFFEVLTRKYVGFHNKPIIIFNAYHFWDPLLNLLEHLKQTKFAPDKNYWHVVEDLEELDLTLRG